MPLAILTVHDQSYEGIGLANWVRPDGKVKLVEVPYALKGEEVEVFLRRGKKRRALYGQLERIITPSALRIEPKCCHFASCGGCSLQHVSYEMQLSWKEQEIRRLFSFCPDAPFHPIMASKEIWGYRNKLEFTFSENKERRKFLGFILTRTKGHVFDVAECPLVAPWNIECVKKVKEWWEQSKLSAYRHSQNSGALKTLTLRHGHDFDDRLIILTVSGNPDFALKQNDLDSFVALTQELKGKGNLGIILRICQQIKGRPTQFFEMTLFGEPLLRQKLSIFGKEIDFIHSPSSFFQPNTKTANALYERAFALAELDTMKSLWDLYCGIGVIGLLAAQKVEKVVGIELSADSCYDARQNIARLNAGHFTLFSGDVGAVLKQHEAELPVPDCIVIDPPRQGLDPKTIAFLAQLKAKKLIFISCNPKIQAANVAELMKAGFRVTAIQPVDQFPHTPHIENICICEH